MHVEHQGKKQNIFFSLVLTHHTFICKPHRLTYTAATLWGKKSNHNWPQQLRLTGLFARHSGVPTVSTWSRSRRDLLKVFHWALWTPETTGDTAIDAFKYLLKQKLKGWFESRHAVDLRPQWLDKHGEFIVLHHRRLWWGGAETKIRFCKTKTKHSKIEKWIIMTLVKHSSKHFRCSKEFFKHPNWYTGPKTNVLAKKQKWPL